MVRTKVSYYMFTCTGRNYIGVINREKAVTCIHVIEIVNYAYIGRKKGYYMRTRFECREDFFSKYREG